MKQILTIIILAVLTVLFATLFILASVGKIGVGRILRPMPVNEQAIQRYIDMTANVIGQNVRTAFITEATKGISAKDSIQYITDLYARESGLTPAQLRNSDVPPFEVSPEKMTMAQARQLEQWKTFSETAIRLRYPTIQKALALLSTNPTEKVTVEHTLRSINRFPQEYKKKIYEAWNSNDLIGYSHAEKDFIRRVIQGIQLED